MIGTFIGRYELLEELGRNMGVVYRALDTRLHKEVALKVLPGDALSSPGARRRFEQEALSLAKAAHPNLVVIHDFVTQEGVDYIVMEFVAGPTVAELIRRGAIEEKRLVRLALQLAKGIAAAHASGVIHRDLKPGNLMVAAEDHLKIVDFGLAKAFAGDGTPTAPALTSTDQIVGTLPYMAPEVLRGHAADERSDLYAVGVVLYEMATGHNPHGAGGRGEVVEGILDRRAVPPTQLRPGLSRALERIILKLLAKDPASRYASATELVRDLDGLNGAGPAPPGGWIKTAALAGSGIVLALAIVGIAIPSVRTWVQDRLNPPVNRRLAVLPFGDISADTAQGHVAAGMREELITALAQNTHLEVCSSTSAQAAELAGHPAPEIARKLGVRYLIEGTTQGSDSLVRISINLVDALADRQIWSQGYLRSLGDVLALEHEVALTIAAEVGHTVHLDERAPAPRPPRVAAPAMDDYFRGRALWQSRDPANLVRAMDYYRAAIAADPSFAQPHAGLADAYNLLGNYALLPQAIAYASAKEEATRALALDPGLADAHVSLAMVNMEFEWDWEGAAAEFQKAIELAPSNPTAHQWYAELLSRRNRPEAAAREIDRALELDPESPPIMGMKGTILYHARKPREALAQYDSTLARSPGQSLTLFYRGLVLLELDRPDDAIASLRLAVERSGGAALARAGLGYVYGKAGRKQEALEILHDLKSSAGRTVPPTCLAMVEIGIGDLKAALRDVEEGYNARDSYLGHMKVSPIADPLRSDPHFIAIMKKVGV